MRVLFLNQYFHPDQSATSQLLTELAEDLARHHEVDVVSGRPSYNPTMPTPATGLVSLDRVGDVTVARVWSTTFHRSRTAGRVLNYLTYLATAFVGALRLPAPDVVVAMTDPPPVGLIGVLVSRVRRAPLVVVCQDVFPEALVALGEVRGRLLTAVLRRLAGSVFASAARVVAIGRDMEGRLRGMGISAAKIRVIPNWADGALIRPLARPSALREAAGWDGRFVVMHSGNVGLSQDLDTLVHAAERLREHEDVVVAIVGDGARRSELETAARRRGLANLRFLPYQPKTALSDSLGAADVHVVSLRKGMEGFVTPSKVYGIMAAGKPFVAAVDARAEPARVAEDHGCGVRVEPGDPEALARAILALRSAPLDEMGRRARAAFEERYDRGICTRAYRALLEEIAAEGRRGGPAGP